MRSGSRRRESVNISTSRGAGLTFINLSSLCNCASLSAFSSVGFTPVALSDVGPRRPMAPPTAQQFRVMPLLSTPVTPFSCLRMLHHGPC
eukprot:1229034-Rhodomonas_salina.1